MFINSDPNSDSEQCTESKLGWVQSAHTQGTLVARTLCARWTLCRGAQGVVSWPPSCRVANVSFRVVARTRALAHRVAALPCHDTKLYRKTEAMSCECWVVSRVLLPCCSAVSQPLARCVTTPGLALLSRYIHLYRDTPR